MIVELFSTSKTSQCLIKPYNQHFVLSDITLGISIACSSVLELSICNTIYHPADPGFAMSNHESHAGPRYMTNHSVRFQWS